MKEYFKPEHLNDIDQRLQIRSNHIYILFISLLNIAISKCRFEEKSKVISYLEIAFRTLLILAGIVSFLAFCFEHTGDIENRTMTLASVVLSLASIGILMLTELMNRTTNKGGSNNA